MLGKPGPRSALRAGALAPRARPGRRNPERTQPAPGRPQRLGGGSPAPGAGWSGGRRADAPGGLSWRGGREAADMQQDSGRAAGQWLDLRPLPRRVRPAAREVGGRPWGGVCALLAAQPRPGPGT